MNYTDTAELGTKHHEWLSKLDFYKNELGILSERLAEIASKNTSPAATAGIEHFQNQFIIQRNNIDELRHRINELEHQVFEDVKRHGGKVHQSNVEAYRQKNLELDTFEKVINELRQEFKDFLSKWI